MLIETINERVPCTSTLARLVVFDPRILQSLSLQNLGTDTVEIGRQGVTYGTGYPLAMGDVLTLTWEDFSPAARAVSSNLEIFGICDAVKTASVQVFGFSIRGG